MFGSRGLWQRANLKSRTAWVTAVVVVAGVAVTTTVELVHLAATPKASKGVAIKGVFGVPPQAPQQGDHASGVYQPSSTTWPAPA